MDRVAWGVAWFLFVPLLAGCIAADQEPMAALLPQEPLPTFRISWEPADPRVGQRVAFEIVPDDPWDPVEDATWIFGDGTGIQDVSPTKTYRTSGLFALRVEVQTLGGHQTTLRMDFLVRNADGSHPLGPAPDDGTVATADPAPMPAQEAAALDPPVIEVHMDRNRLTASFSWDRSPTALEWSFGDGAKADTQSVNHSYLAVGKFNLVLTVWDGARSATSSLFVDVAEVPFIPHVIVGVPDSGFNVYHEVYRRPERTAHPCTYILDYPCDVPALQLTLDAPTWEAAFQADQAIWASIRPGDRYWIPGTNIIGAICDQPYQGSTVGSTDPTGGIDYCILDDTNMHGTGTSSSVLSENPDALLIVVEGNSGGSSHLTDGTLPVDVVNYSWGAAVPLVGLGLLYGDYTPFFVAASGNEGAFPVVLEGQKVHTSVITVGAADASTRTEPGYSGWKTMEFVSEYCRPTADTRTLDGVRERYCGTSFSAPTFAGALSRVILEVRMQSGYTGTIAGGMVDPILGISKADVRAALNHTATYTPDPAFHDGGETVPLVAPWYQWGWGYVARNEVPAVMDCLLEDVCPERPAETVAYMEALWQLRRIQSGEALLG